jgi:hypothetical protein
MNEDLNDDLDRKLVSDLLEVPADFEQKVMARLQYCPLPEMAEARVKPNRKVWLEWLALAGGAALGAMQLGGFIFGIWVATSAG